jgi:hypothetical protein
MINRVIFNDYVIGRKLDSKITVEEVKGLLYRGVILEEIPHISMTPRVLFCWDSTLYIRCTYNPTYYVNNLPRRLNDASELDIDNYILRTILKSNAVGALTLTVLSFMPYYIQQPCGIKEALKDIR